MNERTSLGRLALNGVLVLLVSVRRQGTLNDFEIQMIEETFADVEADENLKRYENVRALFETARKLWRAAQPR